MRQNDLKNVPLTNITQKISKTNIEIEKFVKSKLHQFSIIDFAKAFNIPDIRTARRRINRHNRKWRCLVSSKKDRVERDGIYYHLFEDCKLMRHLEGSLSEKNVALAATSKLNSDDEPSDTSYNQYATSLKNVALDKYFIPWVPEKFHLPYDVLLGFGFDLKYGIEVHGLQYKISVNWISWGSHNNETYPLKLKCNKYTIATIKVRKNSIIVSIGPAKKGLKYGFSSKNIYLLESEIEEHLSVGFPELNGAKLSPGLFQLDLSQDDHRVDECLNRNLDTIEFDGYKYKINEYLVKRGEDHPHFGDEDFKEPKIMRRQEVRLLNKKAVSTINLVMEAMNRKKEDIIGCAAVKSLVVEGKSILQKSLELQRRNEETLKINTYQNNRIERTFDKFDNDLNFVKNGVAENNILMLYLRRDIDEFGNKFNLKNSQINNTLSDITDLLSKRFDVIEDITNFNSDELELISSKSDQQLSSLQDITQIQRYQLEHSEIVQNLLEELSLNMDLTIKENNRWRSIDLGMKLFIINELKKINKTFPKVAISINKHFRVSRQALSKLWKSHKKNNETLSKVNETISEINKTKLLFEDTGKNECRIPYNVNFNNKSNETSGITSNFKVAKLHTGYKNRMNIILSLIKNDDKFTMSKLAKMAKGKKNDTLNVIRYMVSINLLTAIRDPSHNLRIWIKRSEIN